MTTYKTYYAESKNIGIRADQINPNAWFFKKQYQLELAKNQAKAKQHPVTKFLLFENYSHSKIIGNIIKNIQKTSTFV